MLKVGAKLTARVQLVGLAAANYACKAAAAHRPGELNGWVGLGEPREIEERIRSRMPATDDQHTLASVNGALRAQNIRDTVSDAMA
jgi:hypothetical protein